MTTPPPADERWGEARRLILEAAESAEPTDNGVDGVREFCTAAAGRLAHDHDGAVQELRRARLVALTRTSAVKVEAALHAIRSLLSDTPQGSRGGAATRHSTSQESDMTGNLNCYRIDDSGTHYVAAHTPLGALRVLTDLEMYDDATAYSISVECVPDEKVDDTKKIHQSEDAERPEGYTLREALAKARAEGKAQLLCTSEF